ncbi:sugar-binding domain-containing protein [Maribellus sediminis]|uniref:sugar-binding domain-containing protein n=1 Tax=Maribellus sediminis TaxID=2696285 RepID=UPI00142F7C0F|nr:sugar-binding domain-containing protein [Maribellus sediminis]
MKYFFCFATTILWINLNLSCAENLTGKWQFKLDPEKKGITESWFNTTFEESIVLPGSLQNRGFGNDIDVNTPWVTQQSVNATNYDSWFTHPNYDKYKSSDNFKFPYWLQPKKHYIGWAWYQKEFEVSESDAENDFELLFERCHWETTVWLDGNQIGTNNSLSAPHRYTLKNLKEGKHSLVVLVDNSIKINVGVNAHSVSDHTQTNWNGIIGKISLKPNALHEIKLVDVFPSVKDKTAKTLITFENSSDKELKGKIRVEIALYNSDQNALFPIQEFDVNLLEGKSDKELNLQLGEKIYLWDEFNPNLYHLKLSLIDSDDQILAQKETTFGCRDIKTEGTQFKINGRPMFVRGNLDCCVFPDTGYPDMDVESWRKIYRTQKEYGINTVRFHSWCPPEAAFTAADIEGMYLQAENVVWVWAATQDQKDFIRDEARRILTEYGNHPSFVFFGYGNEAGVPTEFMEELFAEWKKDSRRLYTGAANANITDGADYSIALAYPKKGKNRHRNDSLRLRYQEGWPPLPQNNYLNTLEPSTNIDYRKPTNLYGKPLIAHETVQRCTYPDLGRRKNYKGLLFPSYLDIAEDQLKENGLLEQVDNFIQASGKWQVQLFKEEIESQLRTPGMGGFHLLSLNDFPGQGAALVGVVDANWNSKEYVTAAQFKRFCNDVVPLFRMKKRVWQNNEQFTGSFEIANFSNTELKDARFKWIIKNAEGLVVHSGEFIRPIVNLGNGIHLEDINVDLSSFQSPAKYNLEIQLEGTSYINDWDFWVFPDKVSNVDSKEILITAELNEAISKAKAGKKVLLVPDEKNIKGNLPPCFSTIYWNVPWTNVGESSTMGILVNPKHELFNQFPTDFYSNWHWYDLLVKTRPMILDDLPKNLMPIVQLIDDYHQNRKLGVVFEAKIGKGKILVSSIDVRDDTTGSPVVNQFRKSLLEYMQSNTFDPAIELEDWQLQKIIDSSQP